MCKKLKNDISPQAKENPLISVFCGSQGYGVSSHPFRSANKSLNVFLVTLNTVPQIRLFSYVLFATVEFAIGEGDRDRRTDGQPMTQKKRELILENKTGDKAEFTSISLLICLAHFDVAHLFPAEREVQSAGHSGWTAAS